MSETATPTSDLLTREETARALRIAVVTLDGWVRCDRGPAPTRMGGRVFFHRSEVDRFIASQTVRPADRAMLQVQVEALAGIINRELLARVPGADPEAVTCIGEMAALLRLAEAEIRTGASPQRHARALIEASWKMLGLLYRTFGIEATAGTLAEEVANAAQRIGIVALGHATPNENEPEFST
jgi:predicted DNA-binding transcriptional regulator AlpA